MRSSVSFRLCDQRDTLFSRGTKTSGNQIINNWNVKRIREESKEKVESLIVHGKVNKVVTLRLLWLFLFYEYKIEKFQKFVWFFSLSRIKLKYRTIFLEVWISSFCPKIRPSSTKIRNTGTHLVNNLNRPGT